MLISICGCSFKKNEVINELKNVYKDKLIVFDYYVLTFRTLVETESVKYKFEIESKDYKEAHKLYIQYVDEIVINKANEFIENNKDKVIVLITDNILSEDLDKTPFFDKSDLKILANTNHTRVSYDKNKFDLVVESNEKLNTKNLVKL